MKNAGQIKVYYDGLCKVCSKEIAHYMRQSGSESIQFIDIFSAGFSAESEGLDPKKIHKIMHVKRSDGTLATRVDAFIEIWKALPRYRALARIAQNRAVRSILELGYSGFTVIRPYLPRSTQSLDCEKSPYCEVTNAKSSP